MDAPFPKGLSQRTRTRSARVIKCICRYANLRALLWFRGATCARTHVPCLHTLPYTVISMKSMCFVSVHTQVYIKAYRGHTSQLVAFKLFIPCGIRADEFAARRVSCRSRNNRKIKTLAENGWHIVVGWLFILFGTRNCENEEHLIRHADIYWKILCNIIGASGIFGVCFLVDRWYLWLWGKTTYIILSKNSSLWLNTLSVTSVPGDWQWPFR